MINTPTRTRHFLSNIILEYVRKQNKIVIAILISGIKSILLIFGTTIDKYLGLLILYYNNLSCGININLDEVIIIKDKKMITIYKISMIL